MIRYLVQAAALALLLFVSVPQEAHAQGIEDRLEQSFDAMVNYTQPSVYLGARRGVITGGSLTIRTPVTNIRPFSFRGPSISVGCGGIDAFFGAFSFISKEQLVQAMRAIVTAAITYAFQIALEAMCPTCARVLADIQDWLNKANEFLTNSCEATRNFMDNHGISNAIRSMAENWRAGKGTVDDNFEAKAQGDSTSSTSQADTESGGKTQQEIPAEGNQVWRILQHSGDASFGFSDNDFYEEIMSMTGTIIACTNGDPKCAEDQALDGSQHEGQKGELIIFRKPPVMTLAELVEGGQADSKQYKCDTADYCQRPTINTNPVEGMAQKIRVAFLGTGGTNNTSGSLGIINKMRFNYTSTPTDDEVKWMKVGGSLTAMLFRLAEKDPGAARGFVEDNAEAIAAEIIVGYLDKYMLSAKVAAGRIELSGLQESFDLIIAASNQAHADAQTYYNDTANKQQSYQAYLARMQALSN